MSRRCPSAGSAALLLLLCASTPKASAAWLDSLSVSSQGAAATSPDYGAVLSPSTSSPPLLPGFTRSLVGLDYALVAPESRTWSAPVDSARAKREGRASWSKASVAHLISPGRGGSGATFSMSLAKLGPGGTVGAPPTPGAQRFLFVLDGVVSVEVGAERDGGGGGERRRRCLPRKSRGVLGFDGDGFRNLTLGSDGFAFFPPHCHGLLPTVTAGPGGAGLLLFERIHVDRETGKPSVARSSENDENGSDATCATEESDLPHFVWGPSASKLPLLDPGHPETFGLRKLLPHDGAAAAKFDFNVHLMDFDPGEFLVTKEVHHNQHGLLMLLGQGVYRLSNREWFPVGAGDAIYMGPYVTQWFGALRGGGGGKSRYILFKDTAPDPLLARG